jgi:hypothetical protein
MRLLRIRSPMHLRVLGTLISALSCLSFLFDSNVEASDSKPPDFYNLLGHQPIDGIPTRPYSEWTEDERLKGFKLIKLSCVRTSFAGMMSVAQQDAVENRKKEEILTLTAACIAMHLPKDHPVRQYYQTEALKHYDVAKSLGSDFPPPVF